MKSFFLTLALIPVLCFGQTDLKLKLFDGYVIEVFFNKKGEWPITMTFLNDSTGVFQKLDKCQNLNDCIKFITDSNLIVPLEMIPYNTLLKHTSDKCDAEFVKEICKYNKRADSLFITAKKDFDITLKDSSILHIEYAKYYGLIYYPSRNDEVYKARYSCGTIDYSEYSQINFAIPIVSGFVKDDE